MCTQGTTKFGCTHLKGEDNLHDIRSQLLLQSHELQFEKRDHNLPTFDGQCVCRTHWEDNGSLVDDMVVKSTVATNKSTHLLLSSKGTLP